MNLEEKILKNLGQVILETSRQLEGERHFPARTGDESDEYIQRRQDRLTSLRTIRLQLEDAFSTPR